MIIDAHNHLANDCPMEFLTSYLAQLDRAGINKVMICPTRHDSLGGNPGLLTFARQAQDRVIPFAYIDVESDPPEHIEKYHHQGFRGLKIIYTSRPYDSKEFMTHYEAAESIGMPILFHTGFLGITQGRHVNCNHYRPITLDTIARRFPDLRMLCAHMGNPWWDEGFLVMWKHRNIYCDMSGLSACRRDMDLWVKIFKPNGKIHEACEKIVFASDVVMFGDETYTDEYLRYHRELFNRIGLDDHVQKKIFSDNFLTLIGQGHSL